MFINFFNFLGTQQLVEAIEKEKSESKKRIKTLESGVAEEMSNNKKELIGKIETVEADIKKKVEMEANETRFAHCYFARLNLKRKGPFYFCLAALLRIHRNLNQK